MSTIFNTSIFAGETKTIAATVTDSNGVAVDLTSAIIYYTADTPTQISKATSSGITVTDAENGEFEIALSQSDTIGIDTAGSFRHECKALLPSGDLVHVFYGRLNIRPSLIGSLPPIAF